MPTDDYDPLDSPPNQAARDAQRQRDRSDAFKVIRLTTKNQAEINHDIAEIRRLVTDARDDVQALTKATESYERTLDSMHDSCALASMPIETPPAKPAEPVARTVTAQVALLVARQLPWAVLLAGLVLAGLVVYVRAFATH